jgi:hypothetical protein
MTIGKLDEAEARILALQIAATFPGHEASTTQIKDRVPDYRKFSPADLAPSPTRKGESTWQQIVGNATGSHNEASTSIFTKGYAVKTEDGIRVTEEGLNFLRSKGLYK